MLAILIAVALGVLRRDHAPAPAAVPSAVRGAARQDLAATILRLKTRASNVHNGARVNSTAETAAVSAVNTTKTFEESCTKACNKCQAQHGMPCVATCYRGCSQKFYDCNVELDPVLDGCDDEMWSAMPGGRPNASRESVRTYRICEWGYEEVGIMEGCRIY